MFMSMLHRSHIHRKQLEYIQRYRGQSSINIKNMEYTIVNFIYNSYTTIMTYLDFDA